MVFDWLFGRKKRSQSDRTERNAVIRRIVTAAAKTGNKNLALADSKVTILATLEANEHDASSSSVNLVESMGKIDAPEIPQDRIAQRAYEVWVRRGRPSGTADRDWNEAVGELRAELADAKPGTPLLKSR